MKDKLIKEKADNTLKENYGNDHPFKSEEIVNKRRETFIEKYGVDNPMKDKLIKEKADNTLKERYGADNPYKSEIIVNKKKETFNKNYGVDHPMKNGSVKEKQKNTCMERYNVSSTLQEKNTIAKIKETNLNLYGDEIPMKTDAIKNKLNETNMEKYGEIRYFLTEEYLDKLKIDNLSKTIEVYSKKLNLSVDSVEIIENGDLKIKNYCDKHCEFIISKKNLRNRLLYEVNICTECHPIDNHESIGESEIMEFVENELNINTNKIKINNKEIDIYFPDYKLGIEYDGLYWHTEKYKKKNYHLNKTIDCEKAGIKLLHVFEDEWLNKKEVVKSIIKDELGLVTNYILSEECLVGEIVSIEATDFLKNNYIMDIGETEFNLGLFYNDELVSVMCFNDNELVAFSNKIDYHVISGADKLLKHFIEIYKPKLITTVIDRRYPQNQLFESLGFKLKEYTEPNCWYYERDENSKYHRFKDDILIDKSKSYKIHDCGCAKFEMIINN